MMRREQAVVMASIVQAQLRQFVDELHAVHARHAEIHEDEVVRMMAGQRQRLFGGMGRIHLGETGFFQQAGHLGALEFMVVQYQDLVFG